MAGLFDGLFNGNPEQQGLMAAYSQLMQDSGPSLQPRGLYQSLGRSLSAGQEVTQQAQQQQQISQMRGLQIKGAESDLAAQQRAREEEILFAGMAKDYMKSPGQQAAALPGGPTAANAERISEMAPEFDVEGYTNAMMAYNPLKALDIKRKYAKSAPEFDTKPQTALDENGQVFQYLVGKNGEIKRLQGMKPRDEIKLAQFGGRTEAYNPYEVQAGKTFQHTMSPDAVASNALGYANLKVSKERLGIERERAVQGRSTVVQSDSGPLVVNTRTGAGMPVVGPDGQVVGPKLRDVPGTVRKTLFENDAALRKVEDALKAVGKYPDALGVSNYLGDTIRQRTDPEGVPARALVADIGSLKIHDRSGAAVTASETPRLKPFIPAATDDVETVKKKLGLFKEEYSAIQQDIRETYSREQGYRTPEAPKPKADYSAIPPRAAAHLKMKPALRAEFDAKFGEGAAAFVLGK